MGKAFEETASPVGATPFKRLERNFPEDSPLRTVLGEAGKEHRRPEIAASPGLLTATHNRLKRVSLNNGGCRKAPGEKKQTREVYRDAA